MTHNLISAGIRPARRLCAKMPFGVTRSTWGLMPFPRSSKCGYLLRATAVQAISVTLLLNSGLAQQNPAEKEPVRGQQSGTSTGGAHAPVKDALSRPITAGGFVDGAPVIFVDMTHTAGLDIFHHRSGRPEKRTILETPGSGVALLDYDNDGWLDIYLGRTYTYRTSARIVSIITITTARLPTSRKLLA